MRRLQWGTHLGLAGGKRVKNNGHLADGLPLSLTQGGHGGIGESKTIFDLTFAVVPATDLTNVRTSKQ